VAIRDGRKMEMKWNLYWGREARSFIAIFRCYCSASSQKLSIATISELALFRNGLS
jgi:hypothetical protein